MSEPLEFATRRADDKGIDPRQSRTQLRVIELAVVVYPAAGARIVHCSQFLQGLVAAMMKRPAPDCPAHELAVDRHGHRDCEEVGGSERFGPIAGGGYSSRIVLAKTDFKKTRKSPARGLLRFHGFVRTNASGRAVCPQLCSGAFTDYP
jgi:hypothetical protein